MSKIMLIIVMSLILCSFIQASNPIEEANRLHNVSAPYNIPEHNLKEKPTNNSSLCSKDESVVFSCVIKGKKKLLSICSSKRLDAEHGYLQYRLGYRGKIEMEFPKQQQNSQSAFWFVRYTRPQVTYLTLRFKTKGYLYSVHENSVSDIKPSIEEATVTVTPLKTLEDEPKPFEQQCREPVKGSLFSLEEVVPNKPWSGEEPTYP